MTSSCGPWIEENTRHYMLPRTLYLVRMMAMAKRKGGIPSSFSGQLYRRTESGQPEIKAEAICTQRDKKAQGVSGVIG
jgi:hypothetical protein